MTGAEPKPTVFIRVSGSQKFDEPTRQALHQLRDEIKQAGYEVKIPIRKTADTVWGTLEHIGIWLGDNAGAAVVGATVTQIMTSTVRWLKKPYDKGADEKLDIGATYVTLYGPDDKPLKKILAKSKDDIKDMAPEEPLN